MWTFLLDPLHISKETQRKATLRMEPKKIALVALAALTFVMLAASCGGNAWQSASAYGYSVTSGLWRACANGICGSYTGKF